MCSDAKQLKTAAGGGRRSWSNDCRTDDICCSHTHVITSVARSFRFVSSIESTEFLTDSTCVLSVGPCQRDVVYLDQTVWNDDPTRRWCCTDGYWRETDDDFKIEIDLNQKWSRRNQLNPNLLKDEVIWTSDRSKLDSREREPVLHRSMV